MSIAQKHFSRRIRLLRKMRLLTLPFPSELPLVEHITFSPSRNFRPRPKLQLLKRFRGMLSFVPVKPPELVIAPGNLLDNIVLLIWQ